VADTTDAQPVPNGDLVASSLDQVMVYRSGATVTRRAQVPTGSQRIIVGDLPLCLDDGSVQVKAEGGPRATGVRISLRPVEPSAGPTRAPAEDGELIAANAAVDKLVQEHELLEASIAAAKGIEIPERAVWRDRAPDESPHEARLALVAVRDERLAALHEALATVATDLEEATRRHRMLAERRARDSSAREAEPHELRKAVAIHFEGPVSEPVSVTLSYQVPGARWAPSYVLRIDEDSRHARLELRAMIAQRTGEDWLGAEIGVSTAAPSRFVDVPELASRRIGRAQRRARDRGWRPPPEDTTDLLSDYRQATTKPAEVAAYHGAPTGAAAYDAPDDELAMDAFEEIAATVSAPPPGFGAPPQAGAAGAPPPRMTAMVASGAAPAAAPMMLASQAKSAGLGQMKRRMSHSLAHSANAAQHAPVASWAPDTPAPPGAPDDDWLDYGRLRMPAPGDSDGRLAPGGFELLVAQAVSIDVQMVQLVLVRARQAAGRLESLAPRFALPETDDYDYAYAAQAPVDVPGDGSNHSVPICGADADMALSLVVVPRASSDAYRQGELDNPLPGPLMPGPVDVYVGRDFLTSSRVRFTPPGARLELGLGVEQGLKVARNARFRESSAGLIGGSLVLHHDVTIDVANHLDAAAEIELRERLPVLREKEDDIKLTVRDVEPSWEDYAPPDDDLRGGRRWRFTLAAGQERHLRFGYDVRISAKNELVGGNRRED
jgi:Domain of unknown function (DUF4139)/N-terminal domain of unknown function (DUF4140)